MALRPAVLAALLAALPLPAALAFPSGFAGDLGVGAFARSGVVRDDSATVVPLPYVYGELGRFFGRLDTFGARLAPLGAGHLEAVLRLSFEGWDADGAALRGLSDRRHPLPFGIGTVQRTPVGAFLVYAMRDATSGGTYLEATWAGRVALGRASLYPLLAVERRSAAYVRHLYGVGPAESAASGYAAYGPGSSTVPVVGLSATVPLAGAWALQLQWRRRFLDGAIADSPIVDARAQDSGYVALSYTLR